MSKYRVIEVTDYDTTYYRCEKKGLFGWSAITYYPSYDMISFPVIYKTLEEAKECVDRLSHRQQKNVVYECGDD